MFEALGAQPTQFTNTGDGGDYHMARYEPGSLPVFVANLSSKVREMVVAEMQKVRELNEAEIREMQESYKRRTQKQ